MFFTASIRSMHKTFTHTISIINLFQIKINLRLSSQGQAVYRGQTSVKMGSKRELKNSLLSSLAPDPSSSCIFDIDAGCVNMELLICKSSLFDQFIAQTLPITFCALYIYMFITCNFCAHLILHSQ